MEKLYHEIGNVRKRVIVVAEISRWIWGINAVIAVAAMLHHRLDLAALAGFTWILSIAAAAIARRAAAYIDSADQILRQNCPNQQKTLALSERVMRLGNQ